MSNDIESKMRAALRPLEPSEEFSQKLMARLEQPAQPGQPGAGRPGQPPRHSLPARGLRPLAWWLSASLAASVILAVGVQQHLQQQRLQQSGLEARREVLEALRMTSQKLNLAYETVKRQSTSLSDEKSGV
jgi:hypothetical protein